MPSFTRGIGLNLLFAAGICVAWAWFSAAPSSPTGRYHFSIQTNIPGWRFESVPLPDTVKKNLATQNLFNGIYRGPSGERVAVFVGQWDANNAEGLSVVEHTPDICWLGGGWKPISLGQPQQSSFMISGRDIPFQVRSFCPPAGRDYELTVWCTVVNGQLFEEIKQYETTDLPHDDFRLQSAEIARRIRAAHFLSTIRYRTQASGEKQFIRFSIPADASWDQSVERLRAFSCKWLTLGNR